MKTFSFDLWFNTSDKDTRRDLKKLKHHIEYLIDFDNLDYRITFYDVTVGDTGGNEVGVCGYLDVEKDITHDKLVSDLESAINTEGWNDLELSDLAVYEQTNLEEATVKALEGKFSRKILKENSFNYEDFVVLRYSNGDEWMIMLFFDHSLTYGEVDQIKDVINQVSNGESDYEFDDIEDAINEVVPFVKSINIDSSDIIDI